MGYFPPPTRGGPSAASVHPACPKSAGTLAVPQVHRGLGQGPGTTGARCREQGGTAATIATICGMVSTSTTVLAMRAASAPVRRQLLAL